MEQKYKIKEIVKELNAYGEKVKPINDEDVELFIDNYEKKCDSLYLHIDFNKYIEIVGQMFKEITSQEYIEKYKIKKRINDNLSYVKLHHSGYDTDGLGGMSDYKSEEEFESFVINGYGEIYHSWEIWFGVLEFRPKIEIFEKYFELSFHGDIILSKNMLIMMKAYCYLIKNNIPVEISAFDIPEIKQFLKKYEIE